MGAAESKEPAIPSLEETSSTVVVPSVGVNVPQTSGEVLDSSIILEKGVEQAIAKAYEEGRMEGIKSQQNAIAQAAFTTYDNAYRELNELQEKKLRDVQHLVSSISIQFYSNTLYNAD